MFDKLPGHERSVYGRERVVLRYIPRALWIGLVILLAPSVVLRLTGVITSDDQGVVSMVDIYALGGVLLYCNLIFFVAMAAFIVMVMKGPAYVADAYQLDDADAPARRP